MCTNVLKDKELLLSSEEARYYKRGNHLEKNLKMERRPHWHEELTFIEDLLYAQNICIHDLQFS